MSIYKEQKRLSKVNFTCSNYDIICCNLSTNRMPLTYSIKAIRSSWKFLEFLKSYAFIWLRWCKLRCSIGCLFLTGLKKCWKHFYELSKKLSSNFKEVFKNFWKNFRNTSIKFFKYFWATLGEKQRTKYTKVLKKLQGHIGIILRTLKKNCEKFHEILGKFGEIWK